MLQNAAEEQIRLFTIVLNARMSLLSAEANYVARLPTTEKEALLEPLQRMRERDNYLRIWFMDETGLAFSNDDKEIDLDKLACYQQTMVGLSGVARGESLLSGEPIFYLWQPVVQNGVPIGALFATLDEDSFREALISGAYGDSGYSFVCDKYGTIIVEDGRDGAGLYHGNILSLLENNTFYTGSYEQLRDDFSAGRSGYFSCDRNDDRRYAVYAPLGLNDWTIIIAARAAAVNATVAETLKGVSWLAIVILLVSLTFLAYALIVNRRYQAKILNEAAHDSVTGLYNRRAFIQAAEEILPAHKENTYAIHCLDVEGFRFVNEQFGHAEGDRLLRSIADKMRQYYSQISQDRVLCRDSADTFFVLCEHKENQLEPTLLAFCQELTRHDLPFRITLRIGIYVVDEIDLPVNIMLDRAQMAQRTVKGLANKHGAYYDDSIRKQISARQRIAADMETALLKQQFEVYFQPQFALENKRMVGAEALVRWRHPERGMIPPDEFIPVFEQNGFIVRLDYFVWEKSCQALRRWKDAGLWPAYVSVNVSRVDILERDLCGKLCALVEKYGLPPSALRLEITESAYAKAPGILYETVNALRQHGFLIEMDDFGKGYSSFNSFKDIPVDLIKLDMDFLSADGWKTRGDVILKFVLNMAKALNISLIAEGVENERQVAYLRTIGCRFAQGYVFARPMPMDQFEALLRESGSMENEEKVFSLN